MTKLLIVTADDFGMHSDFNKGILQVVKADRISAVSVLVNGEALSAEDVKLLGESGARIGLHLDLGKRETLAFKTADQKKAEFLNQFNKFKKIFGFMPRHLDGHYHVHLEDPVLFNCTIETAKKYNFYVRSRGDEIQKLKKLGVKTCDYFLDSRSKDLLDLITQANDGLIELMVHPGIIHNGTKYPTSLVDGRQKDLNFLLSEMFSKTLKQNKIEIVKF